LKKLAIVLIVAIGASLGLAAVPAFPAETPKAPTGSVAIVSGSEINLVSREATLPVVVTNTYDGRARVLVHMASGSPKLQVGNKVVQLSIPAGETMNAQFPVSAIGSGEVTMITWLTSLSGVEIGPRVSIKLRVYPDIENVAIVLFLGLVAALTVVGVIRTMQKRRAR
jgi:hypothetical protein